MTTEKRFLNRAIELAKESKEKIGCGCVIIDAEGNVFAETFNSQRTDEQAVNHAELKAVQEANSKLGKRELSGCVAYCSCEPCAMCLVAFSYAKISRVVFCKTMKELFPDDPQSNLDSYEFVQGLNFVPKLEQIVLS